MARVSVQNIQAWLETTKLTLPDTLTTFDADYLDQLETEVIGRLSSSYDTSAWADENTTPKMVKVVIAKMFAGWYYSKVYSEDIGQNENTYAVRVLANAEMLMQGIIDGTIVLTDSPQTPQGGLPSFYPNDASDAMKPTRDDPSLGPSKFSMGDIF